MWDILHTVAHVSDTKHIFTPQEMNDFYTLLQPLLPCRYCRDSYGGFLEESLEKKSQGLGDLCEKRRLGSLLYDVHERVNRKLLRQKFEKVKQAMPELAALEIDSELVWSSMNFQPTLMILYKRGVFFENEPLKLDATWLLILALSQRIADEKNPNFSIFLTILSKTLQSLPFHSAKEMSNLLTTKNFTDLFSNYYTWFHQQSKESVDKAEFLQKTQLKLSSMVSGACGGGTCS